MLNQRSVNLIKEYEGLELKAYKDAVGVWTIGYGHTAMAGPPVPKAGMVITAQEAEDLLRKDLVKYELGVNRHVKVILNENQHGALTSFVYNLGEGNFAGSTLLKKVNARDWKGAAAEFPKWNKAKGKVLNGLIRRRKAEAELFLAPVNVPVKAPIMTVPAVVDDPGVEAPVASKASLWAALVAFLSSIYKGEK